MFPSSPPTESTATPSAISQGRLLIALIKRDVLLRYRGALFGVVWIVLSPLLMLAVFALVFGQVYQGRWSEGTASIPFWIQLYAGLLAFNVFAETVSRSPTSVRSQANYVKKIIFPVGILPLVPLGASLVHGAFGYCLLLAALGITGHWQAQLLLYPLLVLPIACLAAGVSWFLAAWGVFIKDMTQIVPPVVQILMFLSPVFYPSSAVPEKLTFLYRANPLTHVVEACRAVVAGTPIPWGAWVWTLMASALMAWAGLAFFRYSRDEFADAL